VAELQESAGAASGIAGRLRARHVGAVIVGNALEFYDFLVYTLFAVQIGRCFFPSHNPASSLLLSLATFGAGFLTRPLGGLVIGRMADRVGRRPAMVLSFTLMGLGMLGLALTPSYSSIGVAAPIIVLCTRLLQGFALGGEVGSTSAFLIEAAPVHRRGLYGSLQYMTQLGGQFGAAAVGLILASTLAPPAFETWGWRLAFALGAAIVPFGLLIRRSLPETLHGREDGPAVPPAGSGRIAFLGFLILASSTIATYVQTDLTTYAEDTLRLGTRVGFMATMLNGLAQACMFPVGGWASDVWGRRPLLIGGTLLLGVTIYPAFLAVVHFRTALALEVVAALLGALTALAQAAQLTAITESLPRLVRAGTLAVVYALAIALFGGTTQFVITWLIGATGNPLAPAWYMLGATIIGLFAITLMRESAPTVLGKLVPLGAVGSSAR
jgi:MFS transporter, MHS family, citrate/tricarballylate:H+ symporter